MKIPIHKSQLKNKKIVGLVKKLERLAEAVYYQEKINDFLNGELERFKKEALSE